MSFHNAPRPLRTRSATRKCWRGDMPTKSSMRWNVRPMPRRARRWVGTFERSRPSNSTLPESGFKSPSRQLKKVVLPAPFGPISPTISCGSTSRLTWSSAVIPANDFVISRASRRLIPHPRRPVPASPCVPRALEANDRPMRSKNAYDFRFWNSRMPSGCLAYVSAPRPNRIVCEPRRQRRHVVQRLGVVHEPRDPRGQDDRVEEREPDRGLDRTFDGARPERDDEDDPYETELRREVCADVRAAFVGRHQSAAEPGDRRRQRERDDAATRAD